MLKGVNKLIIEINNPGSDLFERAIFFVKPEKSHTATKELNRNVSGILNKAEAASKAGRIKTKNYAPKIRALLMLAGAAGMGAIIAVLILLPQLS